MQAYLTTQIIIGKLTYVAVVKRYPKYQARIDEILAERGYGIDKDGNCVPLEK